MTWEKTRGVLADIRLTRGMTQRALARRVGIHQSMLSDWEYGRTVPRLGSLVLWAEGISVCIDIKIVAGEVHYIVTDIKTGERWA